MADVLLIDDDPLLRGALLEHLKHAGVDAEDAQDGLDGLAKARQNQPKIIILDEMMPRMSGQEFIEALRAEEWGKQIEVIVLTAIVDTDMINKKLEAGVSQYIDKTQFSSELMVSLITKHLEQLGQAR
jgi:DNA-binding response OmpR family regulator